jgi:HSP20 family protein
MTTLVRNKPLRTDFLEGFWDRGGIDEYTQGRNPSSSPAINIRENKTAYGIELGVPGYEKEDFDVSVDEDMLIIRGVRQEKEDDKESYSHREFEVNGFERSFKLPRIADKTQITARYINGILYVSVPKKENSPDRSKKISIS